MVHASVAALMELMPPPAPDLTGRYRDMVPPPLPDSGADRFDWDALAADRGWRFPLDFRQFLENYGAGGYICGVRHALSDQYGCPPGRTLTIFSPSPVGADQEVDRLTGDASDNLVAWGCDDTAYRLYWRRVDPEPDRWTVTVGRKGEDDDEERYQDYEMGMTDYLLAVLTGRLDFPSPFTAPARPVFEGWRDNELRFREEYPEYRTWAVYSVRHWFYG